MAQNGHEYEHRRQQFLGREREQPLEHGIDEAALLCHADAQQRHEHDAQGVEAGEGLDHVREELGSAPDPRVD